MRVVLLDPVMEKEDLKVNQEYEVCRTEKVRDDLYYIVENLEGEEVAVHELLVRET